MPDDPKRLKGEIEMSDLFELHVASRENMIRHLGTEAMLEVAIESKYKELMEVVWPKLTGVPWALTYLALFSLVTQQAYHFMQLEKLNAEEVSGALRQPWTN